MRKFLLVMSATTAILLANTANAATNGTVTFSGKLSDQTCQVTLNDGTSGSGTVVLPGVPKSKLLNYGMTAGATSFRLKLTGCKSSETAFGVTAYFPKNSNIDNLWHLINKETGPDAASGVSLRLLYKDMSIPLGWNAVRYSDELYQTIDAHATSATLEYTVLYINTGGSSSVKAGKFTGIAIYELVYK